MVNERTNRCDKRRSRVPAQAILKQASDLRISIRDVSLTLALCESLNDFPQTTQTQIDCLELKQVLLTHDVFFVDLLASRQITQVEFAAHEHAPRVWLIRLDQELENRVRSTRVNV